MPSLPAEGRHSFLSHLSQRRSGLREALREAMRPGSERLQSETEFSRLALDIFRYQFEANPVYGSFVRDQGIDPEEVHDWREIPSVPAAAFKEVPLICQNSRPIEATFRTSGTTQGSSLRGVHRVRDLSLYRDSLLGSAARFLRPDLPALVGSSESNRTRIRILSLTPRPDHHPDSSLIYMLNAWVEEWDDGSGRFLSDSDWQVTPEDLRQAVERAGWDQVAVLVVGTAFGFVHLLDRINVESFPTLPGGSTIVETGGFKGRSRSVSRLELYRAIGSLFGVSTNRIVNEYGMTELLSQFYEPVLLEGGPQRPDERRHLGPPWTRTRVLDPHTLAPCSPGDPGVLSHIDLANLDSVCAVLTEDWGVTVGDGFRVLGRSEGAEARGCSLAMEDLPRTYDSGDDR